MSTSKPRFQIVRGLHTPKTIWWEDEVYDTGEKELVPTGAVEKLYSYDVDGKPLREVTQPVMVERVKMATRKVKREKVKKPRYDLYDTLRKCTFSVTVAEVQLLLETEEVEGFG